MPVVLAKPVPAKPPVSYLQPEQGLSKNDARYVQIIHTSKVFPGFMKAIGNADFYPIGAQTQPGCENDLIGFCSHVRSIDYYAEALEFNDFASIKCDTYQQASTNSCGTTLSSVRMGARNPEDEVEGIYYVPLNKQYPFGVLYGENMDSD